MAKTNNREEIMGSEFKRIVGDNTKLEKLGWGGVFLEGPIWFVKEGYLLFSDLHDNKIKKWTPTDGITNFRIPSGYANGNTLDKQGRLITCEDASRRVTRTEPDGTITIIASHYEGKSLNSPNDVVVKSDGSIYFTDPTYGIKAPRGNNAKQELAFCGVYRISPDGKTLTLLMDDFDMPNGLTFSPDESRLYVNDTPKFHIRVFDVKKDGTIANGRIFASGLGPTENLPDGMKVDSEGNVYCTGPGGIWVFNPEGEHLGTIDTPGKVTNFAWGDNDWKTMFLAGATSPNSSLFRIRLNIPGIPVP
jgi:gluconolactonase